MRKIIVAFLTLSQSLCATISIENHPFAVLENIDQLQNLATISFAPHHPQCAVLDKGSHTIQLYTLDNCEQPKHSSQIKVKFDITDIEYSGDGKQLAAIDRKKGNILFYPILSNGIGSKPLRTIEGKKSGVATPSGVTISQDNQRMAVSLTNSPFSILIFEKSSKSIFKTEPLLKIPSKPLKIHGVGEPHSLAFSPNGNFLAVVHLCNQDDFKQSALVIYKKETYQNPKGSYVLQSIVFLNERPLDGIAFHPDGNQIAVVDTSEGILFFEHDSWNTTFRHYDTVHLKDSCRGISFNPTGDKLAVTTDKHSVLFYHLLP